MNGTGTTSLAYKRDDFDQPIEADVYWSNEAPANATPIVLVYHLGGFIVGNSGVVPESQILHLVATLAFTVIVPNYRLAPQVTAREAFLDAEASYDWAVGTLPKILKERAGITLDPTRVVATGHSSGGTIALHLASCRPIKAVTAFYPSLFLSDRSTSAHEASQPASFRTAPDFFPDETDWAIIKPEGRQLSAAVLAPPGQPKAPRNKWQTHLLKHGEWMSTIQPDGRYEAIDPMTRLGADCPPVMIVQGEVDAIPGSSLKLALRAESELREAGVGKVEVEVVRGQGHVFDLAPGASQAGDARWLATVKGLDWLKTNIDSEKRPSARKRHVPQMDVSIRYE